MQWPSMTNMDLAMKMDIDGGNTLAFLVRIGSGRIDGGFIEI